MPKSKTIGKKELKKFINANGFFYSMQIELVKNAPDQYAKSIPEGASYFEGVVSNGELNRNGYIIRPQALIDSLGTYMLNPVILLQHDTDEPIGHCLSAEVRGTGTTQEVFVRGYIYDDLTGGRFGRNLFRGLSTGHIPQEVEFENSKTGQVISEEDFRKFNWEEQYSGDWVMAVTKLDWVEFSLVGIGSVKRALVTSKNCIESYLKNNKLSENTLRGLTENDVDDEPQDEKAKEPQEAKPNEEVAEPINDSKQPEPVESSENADETPAAKTEDTVEKDGEGDSEQPAEPVEANKIRISKADRERLKNASDLLIQTLEATMADEEETKVEEPKEDVQPEAKEAEDKPAEEPKAEESKEIPAETNSVAQVELAPDVKNALQALVDLNFSLEREISELKLKIAKTPDKRGLSITSQFNTAPEKKVSGTEAMVAMLRNAGVLLN